MQTLQGLFQRLERVARDLARQQNKKIAIHFTGHFVELDKTILERLTDPLTHIIRNAVDHGIESTDDRIRLGKPPTANIHLDAQQNIQSITLAISDDGKGLDTDKIRKKALEKGLINPDETLTDAEIYGLIMVPGFSTAESITEVSGRGVGMDVVKKTLDENGGSITIASEWSKGTKIHIEIPATVSIINAFVVEIENLKYVVPCAEIIEIIQVNSDELISTTDLGRALNLRGATIPVEPIKRFLPARKRQQTASSWQHEKCNSSTAIIVAADRGKIAFLVDKVLTRSSIFVKSLQGDLAEIPEFSGAAILSDGEPGVI